MTVTDLVVSVHVESWEIHGCRALPFVGQSWAGVVSLGGSAVLRRDDPPPSVTSHADGTTTVVGRLVRDLTEEGSPASALDAGQLRVVLHRGGELGAMYEVHGALFEEAHCENIRHHGDASLCTNRGGVVTGIHVIPDLIEERDGETVHMLGDGLGTEVQEVSNVSDDSTLRLTVSVAQPLRSGPSRYGQPDRDRWLDFYPDYRVRSPFRDAEGRVVPLRRLPLSSELKRRIAAWAPVAADSWDDPSAGAEGRIILDEASAELAGRYEVYSDWFDALD